MDGLESPRKLRVNDDMDFLGKTLRESAGAPIATGRCPGPERLPAI